MTYRTDRPAPRRRAPFSLVEKVDVCRGLFAAMVVVDHSLQVTWGVHPGTEAATRAFGGDVIGSLFETASIYVMGFFVISGFCIERSVARQAGGGVFPARAYALARLSRVLPLYYAALAFAAGVEWAVAGARPATYATGLSASALCGQALLVQNLTETFGSFVPSWSLTNECFYYALYGVLAWGLAKRQGAALKAGLGLCCGGAAVAQVLYATVAHEAVVYRVGMLLGLGAVWYLGAIVARQGGEWLGLPWGRIAARSWPVFLAGAFVWRYFHMPAQGLYLLPGVAFALLLLRFLEAEQAASRGGRRPELAVGWPRARGVESLGLMSYPMYLFHAPLLMLAGSLLMRLGWASDWRLTFVLLLSLGLTSGLALGWVVERPFMRWRSDWLRRNRLAGAPAQPVPRRERILTAGGRS